MVFLRIEFINFGYTTKYTKSLLFIFLICNILNMILLDVVILLYYSFHTNIIYKLYIRFRKYQTISFTFYLELTLFCVIIIMNF